MEPGLEQSLEALSKFFVGEGTLEQTLDRVSTLTRDAVPAADLVGLTLVVEGRERTAVFTDKAAPEIDQAQYDTGEGPCLAALQTQSVTSIESTTEPGPWQAFRDAAAAHGIRSTLSFPLGVDGQSFGAMNLYSRTERGFDEDSRHTGELFAAQASVVLANAQVYWDARDLGAGLGEAMKNRAVIEQAKGILMSTEGCTDDDAFEMLVKASQRENKKLRTVAQQIVEKSVDSARKRDSD